MRKAQLDDAEGINVVSEKVAVAMKDDVVEVEKAHSEANLQNSEGVVVGTMKDDLEVRGKGDKEIRTKHAAVVCLGSVLEAAGDSAVALSVLAITTLIKLLKPASNYTGLRAAIFKSCAAFTRDVIV